MAEHVERQQEASLPIYEMLKALKIVDKEELNEIIKQRENNAYLLKRKEPSKQHFLDVIRSEKRLLNLIRRRKHMNQDIKLEETVLESIAKRYIQATERFKSSQELWDLYIRDSINLGYSDVEKIYEEMLKYHGSKAENWITYIDWQIDLNGITDNKLRYLLLRATKQHPSNFQIFMIFFNTELDDMKKSTNQSLDALRTLYRKFKFDTKEPKLIFDILQRLTEFPETVELQYEMMNDLKGMFQTYEMFWNVLAQRELNAHVTFQPPAAITNYTEPKQRSLKKRINVCCEIYKSACKMFGTKLMLSMYLEAIIKMNHNLEEGELKRCYLGQVFEQADKEEAITADQYIEYIQILRACDGKEEDIETIFKRALTLHPDSVTLWLTQINFHIKRGDSLNVRQIFDEARKKLDENKCLALYDAYYDYLRIYPGNEDLTDDFFREIMLSDNEIFDKYKVKFLELRTLKYTIVDTRDIFIEYRKTKMPSLAMLRKMIDLEISQVEVSTAECRKMLDLAIKHKDGQKSKDLWLKYIDFELRYGEAKNISRLHNEATKMIDPVEVEDFISEFELLRQGRTRMEHFYE